MMVKVVILKNDKAIKQFNCPVKMKQKYFELAVDMAGGMWNGIDNFKVVIN